MPKRSSWRVAQFDTLRLRLIKTAARIVEMKTKIKVHLPTSAPDQSIVVRLTASRPGQISFEGRMQTPQRATVEATSDGDLVMRGVNGDGNGATADGKPIPGALRFEARACQAGRGEAAIKGGYL